MSRSTAHFESRMRWEFPVPLLLVAMLALACATSGSSRPAKLELQESGFTITEDVHVGFGVRADFDDAVRLLKEELYEESIALFLSVTEAAPQLTTAHLALALGSPSPSDPDTFRRLADQVRAEVRQNAPLRARLLGALNPISWWWTR